MLTFLDDYFFFKLNIPWYNLFNRIHDVQSERSILHTWNTNIYFKRFVSLLEWLHTLHTSFALLNYSMRRVPFVCCLYFLVSLVLFQSQLRAHVLLHRIALELRQLFLFLLTQLLSCNNWCSNSIHRFYAHKMEYTNKCITIVSMWIYMFYFYARMFFNI